jgi:hypothetical protein
MWSSLVLRCVAFVLTNSGVSNRSSASFADGAVSFNIKTVGTSETAESVNNAAQLNVTQDSNPLL